jgi:acyl-CoA-binding protein
MTGAWPKDRLDHIDGSRDNNAWVNLRQADASENAQNQYKAQSNNKSSGLLGVSRASNSERWTASININGKCHRSSTQATKEEARQAYLKLKEELHPFGMLGQEVQGGQA